MGLKKGEASQRCDDDLDKILAKKVLKVPSVEADQVRRG